MSAGGRVDVARPQEEKNFQTGQFSSAKEWHPKTKNLASLEATLVLKLCRPTDLPTGMGEL